MALYGSQWLQEQQRHLTEESDQGSYSSLSTKSLSFCLSVSVSLPLQDSLRLLWEPDQSPNPPPGTRDRLFLVHPDSRKPMQPITVDLAIVRRLLRAICIKLFVNRMRLAMCPNHVWQFELSLSSILMSFCPNQLLLWQQFCLSLGFYFCSDVLGVPASRKMWLAQNLVR